MYIITIYTTVYEAQQLRKAAQQTFGTTANCGIMPFFIFVYVVDICLHALLCLMLNMKKIKLQRMHWIHLLH